jgi:hypothetical protein
MAVLALIFLYLYQHGREKYLAFWALGFAVTILRYGMELVRPEATLVLLLNQLGELLAAAFFFWGTHQFVGREVPRWWFFGVAGGAAWIVAGIALRVSFFWLSLPTFLFSGLNLLSGGVAFLRWGSGDGLGPKLVGRLAGTYSDKGRIHVAQQVLKDKTITMRLMYISNLAAWWLEPNAKNEQKSAYLSGKLPRDLAPGRYTVNVELDEYERKGDELLPAPATHIRHRERLSSTYTVYAAATQPTAQ